MANYPSADPSFSAKSAGQTIASAHVNALQEEVVAIGAALRGTLQHDVTLAAAKSLNVGGNSTFSGAAVFSSGVTVSSGGLTVSTGNVSLGQNLQVTGTSTFTGAVTFSTIVNAQVPSVRLSLGADLAVAQATWTSPGWVVQDWSVGGMHSTASNSSRITFAHSTGVYAVGANMLINNPVNNARVRMRLRYNDSTGVSQQNGISFSGSTDWSQSVTGFVRAADTSDYVTVMVHYADSTTTVRVGSTESVTHFWAHKVSK